MCKKRKGRWGRVGGADPRCNRPFTALASVVPTLSCSSPLASLRRMDDIDVDVDALLGLEGVIDITPANVRPDPRRHRVVCKHWLRGLCKKGDSCDFLHRLDHDLMPECWYFTQFGECGNKECIFLHVEPGNQAAVRLYESSGYRRLPDVAPYAGFTRALNLQERAVLYCLRDLDTAAEL